MRFKLSTAVLWTLVVVLAGTAQAKTCVWINTETASAQDWTVAANWDCGNVPTAGDDVVVTNAAYINFASADIGSVLHTAGDLKIAAANATPLTLNGDFTTRGKTVYNYAKIVLTEGEHVLSNTCAFVLCKDQEITGVGSLVKTGAGEVKGNAWDGNLKLTFTGKLTIRQGAFSNGYYTGFGGPTEIEVDGSASTLSCQRQGNDWLNPNVVLRLKNGGKFSANFDNYSHTIKELYIDDEQSSAQTWYLFSDSRQVVLPASPYLTGGKNIRLVVTDGPTSGGYTGFRDDFSTGVTCEWTGAANTTWANAANWKDGKVPSSLDSVILAADAPNAPASVPAQAFHDFINRIPGNRSYNNLYLYGDLYLATGKHTWSFKHLKFFSGVHYLDGPGTLNPYCDTLECAGSLYKIGSGTILDDNNQYKTAWSVKDLVVSNGTVQLHSATTFTGCTNLNIVAGLLIVNGTSLGTTTPLRIGPGARVQLPNNTTVTVGTIDLDGVNKRAGRTYGSTASAAQYQDNDHFVVTSGMLAPETDLSGAESLPEKYISVADISIQAYAGQPVVPSVTVTDATTGEPIDASNFTVTCTNNTSVGTGTAYVTGKVGTEYEGLRVIKTFVIAEPRESVTCVWINTATASAQDWTLAANWADGVVPLPGDNVVITNSAFIDLSGAVISNLVQTAGSLALQTSPSEPLQLMGDLLFAGASVAFGVSNQASDFYVKLLEGEHVLSNACEIVYKSAASGSSAGTTISGPGSLVKRGRGAVSSESQARLYLTFTGAFAIEAGTFTLPLNDRCSGPTDITVRGTTATLHSLNQNANATFNSAATVYLANGGALSFAQGKARTIRRLFIDGQQAAAGIWKGWASSATADYRWGDILPRDGTSVITVTEGPGDPSTAFAGLTASNGSGRVRHFLGTGSLGNGSYYDPANWQDGLVARELDDVIFENAVTLDEQSGKPVFHNLTVNGNVTLNRETPIITGDLQLNANFNMSWQYRGLEFAAGTHIIDGSGTLTLEASGSGADGGLKGAGALVKRGTGNIAVYARMGSSIAGPITVESGTFLWGSDAAFTSCTNFVADGANAQLKWTAGSFSANATVVLTNNACLYLGGVATQSVCRLEVEGETKRVGRTYGSSASPADWQDDVHFRGSKVVKPTTDRSGADPLPSDRFDIMPIGTAYYDFKTPCRPEITVVDAEGIYLPAQYYTVTYEDNTSVGTGRAIVTGAVGTQYEGLRFIRFFTIEKDPSLRDTCYWINPETASAQAWNVASSWLDINGDSIGDPPATGDHVVIGQAANIDFGGADIGNLVHTNGDLTLSTSGSTTMTLRGNFITTGKSVTTTAKVVLSEGEHVISNTCKVSCGADSTFSGTGSFIKMGCGDWGVVQFKSGTYSFTGELRILEGTFQSFPYSAITGPTLIVVDGPMTVFVLQRQGDNALNANCVLKLQNGGRLNAVFEYTVPIRQLWIEGKQCVAGNWYPFNPDNMRVHTCLSIYGNNKKFVVAEGPEEGGYEGFDTTQRWSGRTCTWLGGGKTSSATDPTNWKDGIVSWYFDNVVIAGPGAPEKLQTQYFNNLTIEANWTPSQVNLAGNIHLGAGTMSRGWANYYLYPGQHVIDGTNSLKISNGTRFSGPGGLTWRCTGNLELPQYYNGGDSTFTGDLRWEAGKFIQDCATSTGKSVFGGTTNVVITGAGAEMRFNIANQPGFSTNVVLKIEKGGKLNLCTGLEQKVRQFHTTTRQRNAHQYTGAGDVGRKLPDYLLGKGVLTVREDGPMGSFLRIR